MRMSKLVFIESTPMHGREVTLLSGITLGRDGCDVVLSDPEVSRRHAVVAESPEGFTIEDLGSTNGTWVNGERIDHPQPLRAGDEIRFGNTVWHVRTAAAAGDGRTTIAGVPQPRRHPGTA
jgi:predicted component of type VI protein secretion system